MAPVYQQLRKSCNVEICLTAQHRQMLDQVMAIFGMEGDYDLDIMSPDQSLTKITRRVLEGLEDCYRQASPDFVFVHGDTTTTFAASLAAFYQQIPVCHVEAGLRTGNIYSPFPEEMNRKLTSAIATYHFAPTSGSRNNLLNEGVEPESIFVTGNTAIDALHMMVEDLEKSPQENRFRSHSKKILVTAHRRENFGDGMENICRALLDIVDQIRDAHVIIPVHYNPNVRPVLQAAFAECPNVSLIDPLEYRDFVQLLTEADLVITDSGGVQEEAPSLGKPVLVMRECTERPEAVEAGTVILVGTDPSRIAQEAVSLLSDQGHYDRMARAVNPYGDGQAAARMATFMENILGIRDKATVMEQFTGIPD